jgi:ribonuclease BN (tRNA processing enzyme)
VRFVPLGVRGSTPAPGADFVRYGGHTSCVAVYGDSDESPHLVLDAGTGLRNLPPLLGGAPYRGDIYLSHLHWDHVQGLPFCPSVDRPDAQVRLFIPVPDESTDPHALLAGAMSPPHFPIGPDGLLGDWQFLPLRPGVQNASIATAPITHKGGIAYAIRVELDGAVLAYLPDHALHGETDPDAATAAAEFADGADVLLHDGQYVETEQTIAANYAHATVEAVIAFADRADVGSVLFTHHSPVRTDAQLDALAARYGCTPGGRPVGFVRQDQVYRVHPDGAR